MTIRGHRCPNWQCFSVVSVGVSSAKITPRRWYDSQTAVISVCLTNGSPSRSAISPGWFSTWIGRNMMPPPHKAGVLQTPASLSSPPQVLLHRGHRASQYRYRPKNQLGQQLVIFHGLQGHTASHCQCGESLMVLLHIALVIHAVNTAHRPLCRAGLFLAVSPTLLPATHRWVGLPPFCSLFLQNGNYGRDCRLV